MTVHREVWVFAAVGLMASCGRTGEVAVKGEDDQATCADGLDNDGDTLADCLDPRCAAFCIPPSEACGDGLENDGDTLADCDDPGCWSDEACRPIPCAADEDCPSGMVCVGAGCVDELLVWPNPESGANSDPWLAEHHADLVQIRPAVLALNFVNAKSNDEMLGHMQQVFDAMAEASRWHGYADPSSPPFVLYRVACAVDLRDEDPPPGWPYRNSSLYPRENPQEGMWGFDYEALFTEAFAALMDIRDPGDPGHALDLCELVDRGLVHEVWVYGDADVPDAGAAEILEIKPYYDEGGRRLDRPMNPCAGNGCFDDEDTFPAHCTRTVRIGWMNNTRGPGCYLESLAHGFESIAAWNEDQIPRLSRDFIPFAGYRLDDRYGIPFDSWYDCPYGQPCLSYPTMTSVAWQIAFSYQGTIDPYDPVCGNVHFPPNARMHYDLESPFWVRTTCQGYAMGENADGTDRLRPFRGLDFEAYEAIAGDCMGPFLVWWRQNFPDGRHGARDAEGEPMPVWWPYVYY